MKLSKRVFEMDHQFCLNDLHPGERAKVRALHIDGDMRRRLLDIGLIENTVVECVGRSPGGDPTAYLIRGAVIALRATDCKQIAAIPILSPEVIKWD